MNPNLTLFTDGGARGNPGPAAIGVVIVDQDTIIDSYGVYLGETTNNVAEYLGLINGLTRVFELHPTANLMVYLDTELVVRQLSGEYAVKQPHLKPLHAKAKQLCSRFPGLTVSHIARAGNSAADALVNSTLDLVLAS